MIFAFSRFFWLSLLALLLFGIAQNGVGATVITLAQLRVPPQMRGRVMSLNTLLIMGVRPLGDFPASGMIALVGGPLTVLICAAIVGVYSFYLLIGKPVIRALGAGRHHVCVVRKAGRRRGRIHHVRFQYTPTLVAI